MTTSCEGFGPPTREIAFRLGGSSGSVELIDLDMRDSGGIDAAGSQCKPEPIRTASRRSGSGSGSGSGGGSGKSRKTGRLRLKRWEQEVRSSEPIKRPTCFHEMYSTVRDGTVQHSTKKQATGGCRSAEVGR